jgi:general secretion pathway protein N
MTRRKRNRQLWSPTVASTGWAESTFAEQGWDQSRRAAVRWSVAGALIGALIAFVAFLPAAWVTRVVADATDQRLLLADARGSVWSGSAVPVLGGGAGSRDAAFLPGRLEWTLVPSFTGIEVRLRQACCLNGAVRLFVKPGLGRTTVTLAPPPGSTGWVGQWPNAWLGGLGTPFNTLQLGGTVRVVSPAMTVERVEGRWRLIGNVELDLIDVSSRLTTLDTLGSYKLTLTGGSGGAATATLLSLSTQDGPLQLTGSGTWGPAGVKFRGEARSAAMDESALANLLNIIGRRDGPRSIISIG